MKIRKSDRIQEPLMTFGQGEHVAIKGSVVPIAIVYRDRISDGYKNFSWTGLNGEYLWLPTESLK
jgi:hypothetical protein